MNVLFPEFPLKLLFETSLVSRIMHSLSLQIRVHIVVYWISPHHVPHAEDMHTNII